MKYPLLAACLLGSLLAVPALANTDMAATGSDGPTAATDTTLATPTVPIATADKDAGTSYHFVAVPEDSTLGTKDEVDFVDSRGGHTTVLEIPKGTKILSPMDRAKIIAGKLQTASDADWFFWKRLKPAPTKNKEVVLAFSEDGQFVVTADGASAALRGYQNRRDAFAVFLLAKIKTALGGMVRDEPFDYQLKTSEEKTDRADIYRQQGDKAYLDKREARAEIMYMQAKKVAPDYETAYLSLAGLYLRQGSPEKAKAVLKEGMGHAQNFAAVAEQILGDQDQTLIPLIKQLTIGA